MKYFLLLLFIPTISSAQCNVADALNVLRPGAEWLLTGNNYGGITWLDAGQSKPSRQAVLDQIQLCLTTEQNNRNQMQNDIYNIRLSSNTADTKLNALIDLLRLRGQL